MEEWRNIVGLPYEASSLGRIRRTESRTCSPAGTIITGRVGKGGYRYFNVTISGKRKTVKFHRLVCEAFHGAPPSPKHHAAHNDGNRDNNSADNLRWALAKENQHDRRRHGTAPIGTSNPRSKLHEDAVRMVRQARQNGATIKMLAECFGVGETTISHLLNGDTWKHV